MLHDSDDAPIHTVKVERAQRSVLRRTSLVALVFLLAVPGAYLAWSPGPLSYQAEGSLWISGESSRQDEGHAMKVVSESGPESEAWASLFRSYEVLGPVAERQLSLQHRGERTVRSPQDAARDLSQRLVVSTDRKGRFVHVAIEGTNQIEMTRTLDAIMDRAVEVAGGRLETAGAAAAASHTDDLVVLDRASVSERRRPTSWLLIDATILLACLTLLGVGALFLEGTTAAVSAET